MPADVAVLLRGALYAELGRACEDAPGAMPESNTRTGWTPVLRRISTAVRGLSALGWAEPDERQPLTIALDAALIEVLEADAEQWEWLSEQDKLETAEGRARAAEHAATIGPISRRDQTSRLNSSRLIPAVRRMFPKVPLLTGWLPWTGTGIASGTVGWRMMWWLPRTRLTYQPWPSRTLTSCLPETAGV
jgi:hypothetical protein